MIVESMLPTERAAAPVAREQVDMSNGAPGIITIEQAMLSRDLPNLWRQVTTPQALDDPELASVACVLNTCSVWGQVLADDAVGEKLRGSFPASPGDIAYAGAYCQPLVAAVGLAALKAKRRALSESHPKLCQSDEVTALIDATSDFSEAELVELMRAGSIAQISAAVQEAFRSERGITGFKFDDLRDEIMPQRMNLLALLFAGKFSCRISGACDAGSAMLFGLCQLPELDCSVGADLNQIAKQSLTPRELIWWQSAQPGFVHASGR